MASFKRKVKKVGLKPGFYPWGKAELTDKWVILHKEGSPKWAIYYKHKRPSVAIPCNLLKSRIKR
jgi:hypothetical protein